ncbi:MAG: hypothetical protein K0S56_1445 [Microvirga sp.]|jgi:hypothetical protein|nr:hypothetical protein [Microvirga sp.]
MLALAPEGRSGGLGKFGGEIGMEGREVPTSDARCEHPELSALIEVKAEIEQPHVWINVYVEARDGSATRRRRAD